MLNADRLMYNLELKLDAFWIHPYFTSPGSNFGSNKSVGRRGCGIRKCLRGHAVKHAYQIDGRLLRTGAANFSASGLKRQDNDLIVIKSAEAAAAFKRNFEARFARGEMLPGRAGQ
jgi:hypothetical protein